MQEIKSICGNCARFPGRKMLYNVEPIDNECPIKPDEHGNYHYEKFNEVKNCPKWKDGMADLPEDLQYSERNCFWAQARDKKCYPGCALYDTENGCCILFTFFSTFVEKMLLEMEILEAQFNKKE